MGGNYNSNYAKKFAGGFGWYHRFYHTDHSTADEIDLSGQIRFNKAFSVNLNSTINFSNNSLGYATNVNDSVMFALRTIRSNENIFTAKYNFTNKMGLSMRVRHYWSKLKNDHLKSLSRNGTLMDIAAMSVNADYNVNYFNIDMVYNWEFNPGSFFTITWKNAIGTSDDRVNDSYYQNLNSTLLHSNQLNTLSFKLIYFLDYLDIKRHNKRG